MPRTELYNEGTILRLVMDIAARNHGLGRVPFEDDLWWFCEARLASPFLRQRGESYRLSESYTHADCVVGQFVRIEGKKAAIGLLPTMRDLVVIEAKMFSGLSKKAKNAKFYDQASRTVAMCCVGDV